MPDRLTRQNFTALPVGTLIAVVPDMARRRWLPTLALLLPVIAVACGADEEQPARGNAGTGAGEAAGTGLKESAGTGAGGAGSAPSCVPAGGDLNAVVRPLGDWCQRYGCPATIADAVDQALGLCRNTFAPRVTFGCGSVTVDYSDFTGGLAYTFDVKTMQVIGVRSGSDTPFGECHVHLYVYGDSYPECADESTCYPCDDASRGDGGAAGDSDAAGAAGTTFDEPTRCPAF